MNVIVANEQQGQLSNLDVDIIKNISGTYDAGEIVEMFKNFFYSKMIWDVTSLNNYTDFHVYEQLVHGLEADKIIFLLPEGSKLCTSNFLAHLINIGIYNFTTNLNGVVYLLKKSNTLKDVEHILKMANIESSAETGATVASVPSASTNKVGSTVIGFHNVTGSAGSTTLIYMILKELSAVYGKNNVIAFEIDKNDFSLFNDKQMFSVRQNDVRGFLEKNSNVNIILVDLNNYTDDTFCGEVINLIEPSTIKLNKLVKTNKLIFSKLQNKRVILNKSLLLNNDVLDFEHEAGIKVFYNMPPLDERKRNAIISDFLSKLGLLNNGNKNNNSGKIFGLFRR